MNEIEFDLPKINAFLYCQNIQQDVLSKNYDLRGVFQGFTPPGYPFGAEFVTFSRFSYAGKGEFQIDISLFNDKNEKVSDTVPRKLQFGETTNHDLITAWRVLYKAPGPYTFKIFCNNLNLGEYRLFCR